MYDCKFTNVKLSAVVAVHCTALVINWIYASGTISSSSSL